MPSGKSPAFFKPANFSRSSSVGTNVLNFANILRPLSEASNFSIYIGINSSDSLKILLGFSSQSSNASAGKVISGRLNSFSF